MSAFGQPICFRPRKLQCALSVLPFNHIHFLVVKARLCHWDFVHVFSCLLLYHWEFWNMFGCWDGIGERVKILEAVLMSLVHWKGRPLRLEVEVYKASRSWLYHCLVKCIHSAELKWVNLMVVQGLFHLFLLGCIQRSETFTCPSTILFIIRLEVFFVIPDFVKFLGASFSEPRTQLRSLSLLK